MGERLYIIGSGGVGKIACEIAKALIQEHNKPWHLEGVYDDDETRHGHEVLSVEIIGSVEQVLDAPQGQVCVAIADPENRLNIVDMIRNNSQHTFATLCHPKSWIGNNTDIGEGSIIYPGVKIDPDVEIGKHVQINKNSTIGHDSNIGSFTTFAPGVNLGGQVDVGKCCYFGINSATVQNLTVGDNVTIGAGGTVISDISSETVAVGTPAEPID